MCAADSGIAHVAIPADAGSESDEEDDEDDDDFSTVLESVRETLGATQVLLQHEFPEEKFTKKLKGRWFLFHDGDHSIQLAQLTKIYGSNSRPVKKGMTVEAKFWNQSGKQDVALDLNAYDDELTDMKGWVLLHVDMGDADV